MIYTWLIRMYFPATLSENSLASGYEAYGISEKLVRWTAVLSLLSVPIILDGKESNKHYS